jgi:hypothetical protein
MKTAESKPAAKQAAKTEQPFFRKGGGMFVNETANEHGSFFSSGRNSFSHVQHKHIQAKLTIGKPNDKYEQEADHVADKVVQRWSKNDAAPSYINTGIQSKTVQSKPVVPKATVSPMVQSRCASCDQEEKLQKKEEEHEAEAMHGKLQKKPIFESNARAEDQVQRRCADCEAKESLQKQANSSSAQTGSPNVESSLSSYKGSGSSLPASTRTQMESSIGADFSGVKIHNNSGAAQLSNDLNAQAFTHGNDIYFNSGKYDTSSSEGKHLLAHELTHTVQQGASIHRKATDSGDGYAGTFNESNGNVVQRDFIDDAKAKAGATWDATGGRVAGVAADLVLTQMKSLAPGLVAFIQEIRQTGVANYFKNKLMQAVNSIFDGLQNNSALINSIFPQFGKLVARARVIITALAAGNCKPLFAAMNDLKDLVAALAGEAWDAIVKFFQPAVDFFTNLWNSFALPALEWLKQKAASIWNWIKELGAKIWEWYRPLREAVSGAWDYIKGIIGLNADETGQEGLIQWAQRKAGEVWESIKEQLKPIIEPAKAMIAKIQQIIPLTAILNLRKTIQEWLDNVVATAGAMGDDASNVGNEAAQTSLRDKILPAIQQSIEDLRGSINAAGAWVNGKIGEVFTTVTQFFATVKSLPLISFATGIIGWVGTKVNDLNDWIQSKVTALFDMVSEGLRNVGKFLRPVYDTLVKILNILGDILGKLPDFLMGPLWMILPKCIKDPIKKFFIEQILGRMSFFKKLKQIENLWERLEAMAITILKQVFVDGNLKKAIWTFFSTMMDILGLPPTLVTKVIAKAAKSLGDLLNDPLGFLVNFIHALKLGFQQFFGKIGTYLLSGLQAWLFGQLKGTGIEMPTEFSFKSMLRFAFQVLGITVDMLLDQLEEVTGKKGLKVKIERYIGVISNAFEWLEKLMAKDEKGGSFRDKLENAVGNIWDIVLDAVVGWLEKTIVGKALAWVTEKLDPTGVMAVITTIIDVYNVMSSVIQKAKEIFEMIDKVLDGLAGLIKGVIAAAATVFEKALGAAIPVVMAMLSSLFGLDDVVDKVKDVIENLRQKIKNGVKQILTAVKGWVEKIFVTEADDGKDDIKKALSEIDAEAITDMQDDEVKKDEADSIKNKVNKDHPSVIEISSVSDGGDTWDFEYIQKTSKKVIAKNSGLYQPPSAPKLISGEALRVFNGKKWIQGSFEKYESISGTDLMFATTKDGRLGKPVSSFNTNTGWKKYTPGVLAAHYSKLDSLQRAGGVTATVADPLVPNNGSRATPVGFISGLHVRGHLLGAQFGGSGEAKNIVSLFPHVNDPDMKGAEMLVRKAVDNLEVVNYTITPSYKGIDLVPDKISIHATGDGGALISETILNKP